MNSLTLLLITIGIFTLAYLTYGKFLSKAVGINSKNSCPSKALQDDINYTPTSPYILFGHHFASIAGSGPIVGPVLACLFGWGAATLWIILGCIFIGTMHDFAAMFLSVRNEGRSIAYVLEKEIGYVGRQIFIFFCLLSVLTVLSTFVIMIVDIFISEPAVTTSSLIFIFMAPFFAVLTRLKFLSLLDASLIFVPLLFLSIGIGLFCPIDLVQILGSVEAAKAAYFTALIYYAALASILPVWFILQPRDYLNSYLLLVMIILAIIGIFIAQPTLEMPAFINPTNVFSDSTLSVIPNLIPFIFITISCGACSGFHALVASGTSSKQIENEKHIRPVAMGAMFTEGVLAVIAIISIASLSYSDYYSAYNTKGFSPTTLFASGISHILTHLGISSTYAIQFIAISISAFILTTLDTSFRLGCFLWQELILPSEKRNNNTNTICNHIRRCLQNRYCSVMILSTITLFFIIKCDVLTLIWPVVGASNQLLAAITLMIFSLWLIRHKKHAFYAILPCCFMLITASWGLSILIINQWHKIPIISVIGSVVQILIVTLLILGIKAYCKNKKKVKSKEQSF